MYAIRSWFFVRFVTTHTETKTKWQRHSAVRKVKWKAKLLKHSNSDPDAVHNHAHPALGSQTRVDPSSTSTTCNRGNDPRVANHNGILSTANARNKGDTPFTMRNRSEHDPRMIRPHTRPSRTRRTAQVDHRRSGTHFVRQNIRFRASAISQKRISCETSFKTPSATPPPAPLAIPFAVRERS